ncbi:unnamed protein product [Mycena citricolor]|uniref:ThrRS/AlaRS common domain-containing protein n=1 Tax=Mycena citricolor TaxID=2018698 RepID=A0AAD2HIW8_9AGAR|nr:unnamed protein product [Mycena citricolor]
MAAAESPYHRVVSPLLKEWIYPESSHEHSTPVGLLACQRDPLLRQLDATVVFSSISSPPPPAKGKQTKKAVVSPTIGPDAICLEVCLNDTVIFPEGGGQPTDTGKLTTSDGVKWSVLQAKRHGGQAIHYVHVPNGNTEDALRTFCAGAKVRVELDDMDFDRRYDHMSLHTSQHLLSALLEMHLQLPTLSWSLTNYPAPCYVEIPRGISVEEITMIQKEANRLVVEGRKLHVEVDELDAKSKKPAEKLESGRSVGRGLPDDYTGGVHRVVVIEDLDRNPCCGTHLPSLNNLQMFIFPHTEALSRSSTTVARLYFLAGPRLLVHLSATNNYISSISTLLSCGPPQAPERVSQVIDERKAVTRRVDDIESELAKYIAAGAVNEMKSAEGQLFVKHIHRTDDSVSALAFLTAICASFSDAASQSSAAPSYVLVLSSSPSGPATTNVNVIAVLSSDDKLTKVVGDALKSKMGVKGGGKGPRWTGKHTGVWKSAKGDQIIEEILSSTTVTM